MHVLVRSLALIGQIVLVNAVLSGDNALVIAMAARHLPARERRIAMLWGGGVAIGLRLALTLAVSYVLLVPGLRFVGAVLLVGTACKLVQEENGSLDDGRPAPTRFRAAVLRIALADLVMSLDNVVAIGGISQSDPVLLVVGLTLSIVMILVFSDIILIVMNRFRWVVYVGTAVLALTAAGLMQHDIEFVRIIWSHGTHDVHFPMWADWTLRGFVVIACVTSGHWWPRREPAIEAN